MTSVGLLRVAPLTEIPVLLHRGGVDPHELLAEFGLAPSYFENPENVIPFTTVSGIFRRCVERTNCAHFGLLLGQRLSISALGAVGYLGQSTSDVRSALREMTAHLHLHDSGAFATLSVQGGFATLSYTLILHAVEGSEQILDTSMAVAHNILRGLCGPDWRLSGVHFAHARPADVQPYKKFFGVTPRFDADQSALIFSETWLDRPLPSADPVLHKLMQERASEIQSRIGDDLVGQLRRVLRPLVTSSDCSLAVVADHLGMHARGLNRRLAAEGTSFRAICEDVRFEAACQLLKNTRNTAYQIASILGYSDATAFTRAFRRWSGTGPAQWRASRKRASSQSSRRRTGA